LDKTRPLERVKNEGLAALRRQIIKPMLEREVHDIHQALKKPLVDEATLNDHLSRVVQDVLEHVELFQAGDEEEAIRLEALTAVLARYRINVVVDNHGLSGAPVIVEDNPVFRALFGCIEYQSAEDVLTSPASARAACSKRMAVF
jgi:predicted ATP-dependent protease